LAPRDQQLSHSSNCHTCIPAIVVRVRFLTGMAGTFIEAKDLRKTYRVGKIDVEALRGISFSV